MTPEVIATMALMNTSIPPTWKNLNSYTSEMLARSYAASWNVLTDTIGSDFVESWSMNVSPPSADSASNGLSTEVRIAVPSIRAAVSRWRVIVWLGLQALLTFSSIGFIFLQNTVMKPLARSPTVDMFLFDMGEIRRRIGFGVGTADGDQRNQADGRSWKDPGSAQETTQPMAQRVKVFEDEDESLMRLTSENHFSVIRYHR